MCSCRYADKFFHIRRCCTTLDTLGHGKVQVMHMYTAEPVLADTLFSGHILITDTNRGTD